MQPTAVLEARAVTAPSNGERDFGGAPPVAERLRTREPARLLVTVDGSTSSSRQLVWALQEAARRDATVLAVAVIDPHADAATRTAARTLLDAQLRHAIEQTGVRSRSRAALLDPEVFEALTATVAGADLVMVGPRRKTVLRPATPRPPARRPLTRCA